ncbi:hypothetical protein RRG08_064240 [Elysia crispata]|uniref:G-protein coupled receptors family 1 profile domain-containing protein n=1 Tax=Elysia crispata TaxID=231223 RepID=A0AAE1CXC8_9GAST|nr:hypothetical protein RRG08_064240 [Elysia crispata]
MEAFNASSSQHALLTAAREPISDEAIGYLGVVFKLIVNPTLELLGTCANIINMAVFYKMGLADGVTQNFFILSFSDLLFTAIALLNSLTYILQTNVYAGREVYVEMIHLASYLSATFPQTFSLVTTAVIAVVRCCCVAMPLRVKYLITARRQLAAILFFSASALCMLLYAFTPLRVIYIYNERVNSSLPMFVELRWYAYTLFTNIFFYIGFIIVIICVIILTISLNQSSKFREKSSSGGTSTSGSDGAGQTKEGRKEARVVKTVVFLCVIFILCYLPTMIFTLFGQIEPEFSATGFYRNANTFFLMLLVSSMMINANVNIVVYYLYNSRYRSVLLAMFGAKQQQ